MIQNCDLDNAKLTDDEKRAFLEAEMQAAAKAKYDTWKAKP